MTKLNLPKGRKRATRAKDIMSTSLVIIQPHQTYATAVELLNEKRLTALPVVDGDGRLVGILSEKDILMVCRSFETVTPDFLGRKIKFSKNVISVQTSTHIDRLGLMLATNTFRHLPVVDSEGFLKGIISRRDLIRVIYLRLELEKAIRKTHES